MLHRRGAAAPHSGAPLRAAASCSAAHVAVPPRCCLHACSSTHTLTGCSGTAADGRSDRNPRPPRPRGGVQDEQQHAAAGARSPEHGQASPSGLRLRRLLLSLRSWRVRKARAPLASGPRSHEPARRRAEPSARTSAAGRAQQAPGDACSRLLRDLPPRHTDGYPRADTFLVAAQCVSVMLGSSAFFPGTDEPRLQLPWWLLQRMLPRWAA